MNLAEYRAAMQALMGTAVDTSTWTTAILDEGIRGGLARIDPWLVYETEVTVSAGGREQTIGITRLNAVLTIAWPWDANSNRAWHEYKTRWRWYQPDKLYFTHDVPQAGDKIRIRYTLRHQVENLDAAVATTVPARWERALVYMACAEALRIRMRQLSENPAVPAGAIEALRKIADGWEATAGQVWTQDVSNPAWASYGLE